MSNPIIIAVDAMGGDNSPDKIINGISLHSKQSKNIKYKIFGDKNLINPLVNKYKLSIKSIDVVHTDKVVKGEDSALTAAKKCSKKFSFKSIS